MDTPDWIEDEEGKRVFQETAGKTTFSARKIIVDALRESGDLDGEPTPTKRMTNFYEKGDKPLEIVTSRQWYLKNGGTDQKLNAELIERGRELNFHPDFMRVRYENWVNGLNGDWLISRQRFFGVPFPLWYPVKEDGTADYDHPIVPSEDRLPIDPTDDVPEGYSEDQRDVPGGFTAEPDIMDTWATSSLTPQIVTRWEEPGEENQAIFNATFPMDLRPQGQDIIRTWLFSTVDRAHLENKCLPWANATLSGWILDPDHKKMSKSKGNVVVPDKPIKQFGADAVRYWAAAARLGLDATYDEGQMKIGRRLAIKLLNATKFALAIGREDENHHGRSGNRKLEPCRRDRAAGPRSHGQDGPRSARSHRKPQQLRAFQGFGSHRKLLLAVLRRLHRAGQEPCIRHRRLHRPCAEREGREVRSHRAGTGLGCLRTPAGTVPAVRHRRSVELDA